MGGYKLSGSSEPEIKKYTLRIGILITSLNYLDFHIQSFIEAILGLENNIKIGQPIVALTRSFDLSKRVFFLKSLIKSKHEQEYTEYIKLHDRIIKCSEIRNNLAHSQVYFADNDKGTYMMISSIRKELPPEKPYNQLTIVELDNTIKIFQNLINDFQNFTYSLGYFQG